MNQRYRKSIPFICFLFILSILSVNAQEDSEILNAYKDYTDAPREVVYLHLNKSTYIIGETIGFTAYVLDKKDKKPSLITTNLYVTIEDKAQNTIKQKLIMVNNGVASNTFEVDSLFSHDNYSIKAYTKWMKNFDEQNYFIESIKIKDQKNKETKQKQLVSKKIDAQFLPESGHLLHGVENNIGVIIKDNKGYGIPFAEGEVIDKSGSVLTTFKTNKLGIGRFVLIADSNDSYNINIKNADKVLSFKLNQNIENDGVILSVKRLKEKLFVSAITNTSTLKSIKNKRYALMLHNGNTFELMDLYFTDNTTITKTIELDGSPGINIFTLFNENDQPIAERLVFNYQGIPLLNSDTTTSVTQTADSLSINLNYKTINTSQFHNISVSILPKDTKSYQRQHNLISYNYLAPYLKGNIENGKYYFTDINEKKMFELDNLLLTQGWSSYNWNTIFNNNQNLPHNFEQGITVKANFPAKDLKNTDTPNHLMYYLNDYSFNVAEQQKGETNYLLESIFAEENNTLQLTEVTTKGDLKPASLYLQFFPNKIPSFKETKVSLLDVKEPENQDLNLNNFTSNVVFTPTKKVQKLDEVIVKSSLGMKKRERQNKLSRGRFGRVSVIDDEDERTFIRLMPYLAWKAWNLQADSGPLASLKSSGASTDIDPGINGNSPSTVNYFLNDELLPNTEILEQFFLSDVDFIEVNRFGVGDGMKSPNGFIKIYLKDPNRKRPTKKTAKTYKFPLTFSEHKIFYAPKYTYYNDDFYKNYGTIDWKPNLLTDASGNITIKIAKPEVPINLFIEGIANDGSFIFENQSISSHISE